MHMAHGAISTPGIDVLSIFYHSSPASILVVFHSAATLLSPHQTPLPQHTLCCAFLNFFSLLIPINLSTSAKPLPVPLLAPLNDQQVVPVCPSVLTQLLWKEGGEELLLQSSFDFSTANEVKGDLSSPPSLSWRSQNILAVI